MDRVRAGAVRQIQDRREVHAHAGGPHPPAGLLGQCPGLGRRHGGGHGPRPGQVADQVGHALNFPALLVGHDQQGRSACGSLQRGEVGGKV